MFFGSKTLTLKRRSFSVLIMSIRALFSYWCILLLIVQINDFKILVTHTYDWSSASKYNFSGQIRSQSRRAGKSKVKTQECGESQEQLIQIVVVSVRRNLSLNQRESKWQQNAVTSAVTQMWSSPSVGTVPQRAAPPTLACTLEGVAVSPGVWPQWRGRAGAWSPPGTQ